MTKNRALKRAARERAHSTGETYVVARRNTISTQAAPVSLGPVVGTLHRWTHLVPGVPAHSDSAARAGARNRGRAGRTTPARVARHGRTHPVREKRVLRGWQEWIEQRVTR